ncbi:MAG: PAS domain S-box protein [Anaerolineales bacterium]|nr:PAS domain S-box protein [Anaerolineales bacterium]MDW8161662.1 PAS domain S-box protein [Anaerolineales bacterium]
MNPAVSPLAQDPPRQSLEEIGTHSEQPGELFSSSLSPPVGSEADFRALAENALEAIFVLNKEGLLEYVNGQACQLLGYGRQELIGKHFSIFVHPGDLPLVAERREARLRGEPVPNRYEIQLVRKEGAVIPVEMGVTLTRWRGETATLALVHEISLRRELEKSLAEELRLRTVLAELSRNLLCAFDLEQLSEVALREAQQLTQSPLGLIGYLDPENHQEFIGVRGRSNSQGASFERVLDSFDRLKGLWEWAAQRGEAVFTNEFAQDLGVSPFSSDHPPVARLLLAPAKIDGCMVGLLAVANAAEPYRSVQAEQLQRLADLYALALQRHWHEEALRQESRRARGLAHISQTITARQREPSVFTESVAQQTAEVLDATCAIFTLGEAKESLHLASLAHPDPQRLSLLNEAFALRDFPADQPAWQEILRNPQPHCFATLPSSPPPLLTAPLLQHLDKRIGLRSLMLLPLAQGREVIGLMMLCRHSGERAFLAQDFAFAQEVAARLALGMANARLVSDLEAQQALLELRIAERTMELQAEREFVLQVMNSIDLGITVVGRDRRFVFVNRAFAEMLGYAPEELVGKSPHEITVPSHIVVLETQWRNRLQGKRTSYENLLIHKDGTPVPVLITATPRQQGEEFVGSIAVVTDLRQRQLQEEEQIWLQSFRDLLLSIAHTFIEGVTLHDQVAIEQLLGEVGKFLEVDRVYLFLFDWYNETVSNTHEWVAEGVRAEKANLQNIPLESIPAWMERLRKDPYILIPDVGELGIEWGEVRAILEAQAIQSLLVMPVRSGEKLYGFVGFDSVKEKRQWKEEEIYLLGILANQFAGLLIRQEAEEALRESEARYRLLAENVSDVIWTTDLDFNYTYISPSVTALTGYSVEEAMQLHLKELLTPESYRVAKAAIVKERQQLFQLTREEQRSWSRTLELEHRCKDGSTRWMEVKTSLLFDEQGNPIGFLGLSRDISERRRARQVLEYMATHDDLTGLPNRALFNDRLKQALKRAAREKRSLAVFLIDLDHFKELNDSFGHFKGDRVLQEVAQRLVAALRQSDTVARMGGDEFCVILEDLDRAEDAGSIAEKLLSVIAQPYPIERGITWSLSASIGISLYPRDGEDTEALLIAADIAMYRAKRRRNRYRFYSL